MANAVQKQVNVLAKESLRILENNLVMAKHVHRDFEKEFNQKVNGYKKGDTITINRPADFTIREGATRSAQDVQEGSVSLKVDQQAGVDVDFTSKELTLDIDESGVRERVLKPAMIQIANYIDMKLMGLYKFVPAWQGTPGQVIDTFKGFGKGPERLDELSVPQNDRFGILSAADKWGLLGEKGEVNNDTMVKEARTMAKLGNLGGVDTYMSQNVPTHTVGVATGTPQVNGSGQNKTFAQTKDTGTQVLNTDGWTNDTTDILKAGDVFTIAGVYAVNPVTKATLPFLREFCVTEDADSGATTGPAALTISPAIIVDGAQQTVSAAPADNAAITVKGTGGTGYRQNLILHKNAFALATVPLVMPAAVNAGSRQSYKGINLRLIPTYDEDNDVAGWRYDVLFGVKAIDPRLATRLSGTP